MIVRFICSKLESYSASFDVIICISVHDRANELKKRNPYSSSYQRHSMQSSFEFENYYSQPKNLSIFTPPIHFWSAYSHFGRFLREKLQKGHVDVSDEVDEGVQAEPSPTTLHARRNLRPVTLCLPPR